MLRHRTTLVAVLALAALTLGACGDDSSAGKPAGAVSAKDADGERADKTPPPCPLRPLEAAAIIGTANSVAPAEGTEDTVVCSFGTDGESYPLDSTRPFVMVSAQGDFKCDFEHLPRNMLPIDGSYEAVPEWGDGAWKVVLPLTDDQGGAGAEGTANVRVDGDCLDITLHDPDADVATVDRGLGELVGYAR